MEKDIVSQLTDELYHLTLFFPKKEPLKYKMREQADTILENFLMFKRETKDGGDETAANQHFKRFIKAAEVVDSFFEIAKKQKWVSLADLILLKGKYLELKVFVEDLAESQNSSRQESLEEDGSSQIAMPTFLFDNEDKSAAKTDIGADGKVNERQKIILNVLRDKEKAQVWQLKEIFPSVSKRTLRRDFESLFSQGLVRRIGEKNSTFYELA